MSPTGVSRRWSLWSIAVASIFPIGAFVFQRSITDNSFLWHVRAGDAQIDAGAVLTVDPFSFTRNGVPWRTQSWLVELGYSSLDDLIGLWQVYWIVFACWIVFVAGVIAIVRRQTRASVQVALILAMTTLVIIGFFNPRPVIFSYVFLVLLVLADERPQLRWTLPFIMWTWAAVHGSFAIGGLYLVLQAIRHRDRARIPAIAAAGLATLLTAHGLGVLNILLDFAGGGEALQLMSEWDTPNLISLPFFSILAMLIILVLAATRSVIHPRDFWLLIPLLVVMFEANRTVPAAWILLLPLLATSLGSVLPWTGRATVPRAAPLAVGVLLLAVLISGVRAPELDPESFPLAAGAVLEGQRTFASDGAGGYLIYRYWPERLIYVDDRAELFSDEIPEMVRARGGDPSWSEAFTEHAIDEALLTTNDPLLEILELRGWETRFRDEHWVVLDPPV